MSAGRPLFKLPSLQETPLTHRRPPPPPDDDATALLQRPRGLSDANDTDPSRRAPARPEAPTGRFDMGLDDLDQFRPSALPSAYVSEFDVSDLDGDVVEGGAADRKNKATLRSGPAEQRARPATEAH